MITKQKLTLAILTLILSSLSINSFAQNADPTQKPERFARFKREEGRDNFFGWIGSLVQVAGSGALTITTLDLLIRKNINDLSVLKQLKNIEKTGAIAINLDDEQFKYLWEQYLQKEKADVSIAAAKVKTAETQLHAAKGALEGSSHLPTKVDVLSHSESYNMKEIIEANQKFLKEASTAFNEASKELANANQNFRNARIELFKSSNAELFNSADAIAVRSEVSRYVRSMKIGIGYNIFGAVVGSYFLVDSIKKVAILLDDRQPGLAPFFIGTQD